MEQKVLDHDIDDNNEDDDHCDDDEKGDDDVADDNRDDDDDDKLNLPMVGRQLKRRILTSASSGDYL